MENKNIKVVVGVPCSDSNGMNAFTAQSIGGAIIGAGGLVIDMILRRSCDIASNRTWLVNEAIRVGATHLLFVDSDMRFPYDVIPTLLAHKKEIVGCEYNKREFPLTKVSKPMTEESTTELYKAKHNGLGLTLIDLSIFQDTKFGVGVDGKRSPWFAFGRDSQGNIAMGEDAWFSNVARDAGYDTFIDPKVRVFHLGEFGF